MRRERASARHRELGAELRKRRETAGVTARHVSDDTGWSRTKLSRMESGDYATNPVEAIMYLGACGVTPAEGREVLQLCRQAERGTGYWLSPQGEWLEGSLNSLVFHEATANRSIGYEPFVVPGLLQTRAYARVWIARSAPRLSRSLDEALEIRMWRQAILHDRNPAKFVFFVHEEALRTEVGGAAIMHEQLLHMVLMAALGHVTLRIIPAAVCEHSAFGGPFRVFEYRKHRPMVYLDGFLTGVFIEDRDYVSDYYRHLLPELRASALDAGESRKFAANLADEYDRGSPPDVDMEEEQLQSGR